LKGARENTVALYHCTPTCHPRPATSPSTSPSTLTSNMQYPKIWPIGAAGSSRSRSPLRRPLQLQLGLQNRTSTWTTEQNFNLDYRTELQLGLQNRTSTWTTEQNFNLDYLLSTLELDNSIICQFEDKFVFILSSKYMFNTRTREKKCIIAAGNNRKML
jgi:hypothetical protein